MKTKTAVLSIISAAILSSSLLAAEPVAPKAKRATPNEQVTVKWWPTAKLEGKRFEVRPGSTARTCTVWLPVNATEADVLAGIRGCQVEMHKRGS